MDCLCSFLGGVAAYGNGSQPPPPRIVSEGAYCDGCPDSDGRSRPGVFHIDFDGVVVPLREAFQLKLAADHRKDTRLSGGEFVIKSTLLLEIDPRDYELKCVD